jgi:hypothetical protein
MFIWANHGARVMLTDKAASWVQVASAVAVLVGVFLVVVQLRQNEELLRYQIATELRGNRDSVRTAILGEDYSETLAKLSGPTSQLTAAELHRFSAHAFSIYYELTHRKQLFDGGIFVGDWTTWLFEDRCLLFDNMTGKAWLDWLDNAAGGDVIVEQVRKDLSVCTTSFADFAESR